MSSKIIITEDGCNSMISEKFGVSYHSIHGALIETDTVFIDMGLRYKIENGYKSIKIFEMGFGTGLNALRTLAVCDGLDVAIDYTTIEAYPLGKEEYEQLNFHTLIGSEYTASFLQMHRSESGDRVALSPQFIFEKHIGKIEDYSTDKKFDLIYYDAFAPSAQTNLWEQHMMQKMYDMLEPCGALCTYCAKGEFKRTLKTVGFTIENFKGPGRKREITRALKD